MIAANNEIYYRLIALWALCEAMLGGIIHGFRIPVSGLFVGSCAVICISLIAYYKPEKGAIIKATLIVAVFKMLLSPQAPVPAYIAVFFQGLLGELLFWRRRLFFITCILFSILALLESGLQRIIVLTIVYGNDLWTAINDFINKLTGQRNPSNYSLIIGSAYVILHLVTGIIVGIWSGLLPQKIQHWRQQYPLDTTKTATENFRPKKRKRFKKVLLVIWIILLLLYIQAEFKIGQPLLPGHVSLRIFIRSVIIILTWYFLIGPLLKQLLNNWLQKKQKALQAEINQVLNIIPITKNIIQKSWEHSRQKKGLARIVFWGRLVLSNSLADSNNIIILTGGIGSGKTTSLIKWIEGRDDVSGILTPVIDGKRFFLNIETKQTWPMEAEGSETETLQVGKYIFSSNAFDKAINVLKESIDKPGWLIIDELGPLELREEGFYQIAKKILSERNRPTLMVIRENLLNDILKKLKLENSRVVSELRTLNTQL